MDAEGPSRIRVAVVAPHPITRAALRMLLMSAALEVVGEGEAASDVFGLRPAVLLIDVLPGADPGPTVSAGAAARDVGVVVLVDEDDLTQCSAAIGAGAAGLVGRRDPPQELFAAIERVSAGGTSIERSILSAVVRASKRRDPSADRFHTLSKREREVVALVTQGMKNKEIGRRLFISEATVRHHLTSIFGKLGVSGRLELLALQMGRAPGASMGSLT